MPVSYWINESGLSQISNGSEFPAVNGSFQTWQNVQTADVRFIYRGTTSTRTVGRDGINLISFADDSTPLGSSVIAAPYRGSQGQVVGVVGVIGPTRLNYARVVPMVDFTAKALTRLMA